MASYLTRGGGSRSGRGRSVLLWPALTALVWRTFTVGVSAGLELAVDSVGLLDHDS